MSKKIHLLCNAHIDPVWLWRWNEGAAAAISTFRVAADFCEQYDGFVFNHNEALLYEWVEEYEPALFKRIQKLVKDGKWVIMGGWYLQPDCVMTSGESLLNQIALGREYFEKKFGKKPTTAINFDPFGHSRGLVQILAKNGYDSYIIMRPYEFQGEFLWEGFDGSHIKTHCMYGGYNTRKGTTVGKIKNYRNDLDGDLGICFWGVGNHGGGPSKVDLDQITEFIKTSDDEIIHSSADKYMSEVDTSNWKVIDTSLIPCMVGCYTSMARIKQANRRVENKIAITEKIMSYAEMGYGFEFDKGELDKAKKALSLCQFHDILPGSCVKTAEEDALNTFGYAEEIADRLYTRAFFKMCENQKKAREGEVPVLIFNPHPYEIDGEFEVEFMLPNQNWNEDEQTFAFIYDEVGNPLPTQNEKPQCTFNLDWIQKISFKAKIAPSSVSRFDCRLKTVKKNTIDKKEYDANLITVENDKMKVSVNRKTGLIDSYEINGKKYISNSGIIEIYNDNEDPWGMNVDSFCNFDDTFKLMSDEKANEFAGYPDEKIQNVRVIDDGDVRTKIQAFFEYNRSVAVVEYTLPKNGTYIDVDILMYSNEPNKMIKYRLDLGINGIPYGATVFGREKLFDDEKECVYHKWCGIESDNDRLYVLNKGTYGGSFSNNTVKISLLRTPVYSAHPINERQIAPHDRFLNHIDMGERHFSFRITTEKNVERAAQVYNESPLSISFFPAGTGEKKQSAVEIDNPYVFLSSVKKTDKGFEANLYNMADTENDACVYFPLLDKKINLHFGKFELKSIVL